MKRGALVLLAASALGAGAAACGGGDIRRGDEASGGGPCGRSSDAKVICDWTEALRDGDVQAAAGHFSVPTIVQNNTPPLRLGTREAVVVFNRTLPCGAKLTGTRRQGRYTIATFRLIDRPGADCGAGVGGTASTAFLIRGKLIRAWLRVPNAGAGPQVPDGPQSTPGGAGGQPI